MRWIVPLLKKYFFYFCSRVHWLLNLQKIYNIQIFVLKSQIYLQIEDKDLHVADFLQIFFPIKSQNISNSHGLHRRFVRCFPQIAKYFKFTRTASQICEMFFLKSQNISNSQGLHRRFVRCFSSNRKIFQIHMDCIADLWDVFLKSQNISNSQGRHCFFDMCDCTHVHVLWCCLQVIMTALWIALVMALLEMALFLWLAALASSSDGILTHWYLTSLDSGIGQLP